MPFGGSARAISLAYARLDALRFFVAEQENAGRLSWSPAQGMILRNLDQRGRQVQCYSVTLALAAFSSAASSDASDHDPVEQTTAGNNQQQRIATRLQQAALQVIARRQVTVLVWQLRAADLFGRQQLAEPGSQ